MEQVRTWVLTAGAVVLALLILATLVRAVLGPRFTDRIVAVNVISTLVIAELVLLSVWLREDFLVDVSFYLPNTMDGNDTAEVEARMTKAELTALIDELDKLCQKYPDRT